MSIKFPHKLKHKSPHPWETTIKGAYADKIKRAHNSIHNVEYPKAKLKLPDPERVKFTIIGDRVTKEFNSCIQLAKGLHKYRWKTFDTPVIRAVTTPEWQMVLKQLKLEYGGLSYCLDGSVAVLVNDKFLGGEKELKELISSKYNYHIVLDGYKEGVAQFVSYVRASGRPCAYMHIAIDGEHVGTMILMLYSDIVPKTCENFLRLCQSKRGGYSGTPVHRIVSGGWIQCGGFGLKNTDLDCENFVVPHDRRGVLCMANDGRHIDCSTQFFILLQPAPWMAQNYVAFGQLIDGESTLKKIESVPTWYESPLVDITIHNSGILNLESECITINKGTNEYIDKHIEDLVELRKLLHDFLLERVFLEIEFRLVAAADQMSEATVIEEGDTNIRATKRFIRNKEDIEKQLQLGQSESRRLSSPADYENNEFDVEDYEYESEETPYQHVSLSDYEREEDLTEKLFYLPQTDVPYPGEIDSTYDLKKFLKGDYCLESDLQEPQKNKIICKEISYVSEIYKFDDISDDMSLKSLESEEEREIGEYLKKNVDRVSFAGGIIKGIARGVGKFNIFEGTRKSELITDEQLRQFRKVRIAPSAISRQTGTRTSRRPTGFVTGKPGDEADGKRQSVLTRLYENVAFDDEVRPTLKDFQSLGESTHKNLLLTYSPNSRLKSDESTRDRYVRTSFAADDRSYEEMMNIQHGKMIARKVSSDYVKTIDQMEHTKVETSIRSVEYAKSRPSLSIQEYQARNNKHNEELKSHSKISEGKASSSTRGIRLPGDTPVYSMTDVVTEVREDK
ncbi:uncharacterized protein LOC126977887 isoform X2 [Leptidea sinapis]|uniref:uncharacterized protein LOC126977887 isoform X2 n=1 Tax=Leptidea sinapis TaxID=189913 RepID=UPI002134AA18|nr:uncharacterized protein LOC126977887 isoform X2 [Leptidea sinapis]